MAEPELALVFSPDPWVEDLHRHLTDHGGARVRQIVMDPTLALDEEYDILVVSHRWPALTRAFVDALHRRRKRVLGVADPAEAASTDLLDAMGVDAFVAADAPMSLFLETLIKLAPTRHAPSPAELDEWIGDEWATPRDEGPVIAVGGIAGGGATETAIQLAASLRREGRAPVLVDVDDVAPAVAPRLSLPIEPNLRTAIDAVEFGMGTLERCVAPLPEGGFHVLSGLPNVAAWSQVRPNELLDVMHALSSRYEVVVANVGHRVEEVATQGRARYGITCAVLGAADVIVGVGYATPIGVIRLLSWVADVRVFAPHVPVHLVINRAPTDPFRRRELAEEINRTSPVASLTFTPSDKRVEASAWEGVLTAAGPFTRAIDGLAHDLFPNTRRARVGRARRSFGVQARGARV